MFSHAGRVQSAMRAESEKMNTTVASNSDGDAAPVFENQIINARQTCCVTHAG